MYSTLVGYCNRPLAGNHAGEQTSHWDKTNKRHIILNGNFLCLSCPSATFAIQHGGFVPREWLAAKGLFKKYRKEKERLLGLLLGTKKYWQ